MSNEIIINIKNKLRSLEEKYKKDLENYKVEEEKSISERIVNFLETYNKQKTLDEEILEELITKINDRQPAQHYQDLIGFLEYSRKYDKNYWSNNQIKMAITELNNLITRINQYHNSIIKRYKDNAHHRTIIASILDQCNTIVAIIEKIENKQPITENEFDKLMASLKAIDIEILNDEEKKYLIEYISRYNADYINQLINKRIAEIELERKRKEQEQQKKEEAKKEKIIKKMQPKKQEKPKEETTKEIMETPIKVEEEKSKQDELIEKARQIVKQTEDIKDFPIATGRLKESDKWKTRYSTYNAPDSIEEQLLTIAYDLIKFIIPRIEKELRTSKVLEEQTLDLLERIIKLYEEKNAEMNKKEQSKEEICEQFLRDKNMEEHLTLLENCIDIINKCLESPEFNIDLTKLNSRLKDYYESLNEYINEPTEENLQLLNIIATDLNDNYLIVFEEYNSKTLKESDTRERLINEGKLFYEGVNSSNQNIYFFTNFENDTLSTLEEDVISDKRIPTSTIETILKVLRATIGQNIVTKSDTHKAKSSYYSEDFLKNYHVKSIECAYYRITYSLFNVSQKINGKASNIMFIHSIGFGATDGKTKSDTYNKGLKVCYDHKKEIDRIVELFRTDLEKLDKKTVETKLKEMKEILDTQYLKLGHLIEAGNPTNKGKKRGDGSYGNDE